MYIRALLFQVCKEKILLFDEGYFFFPFFNQNKNPATMYTLVRLISVNFDIHSNYQ